MVLALDLLILFLFSIYILSISDCWKCAGLWAVQKGREGNGRALTETLKPVCLCTLWDAGLSASPNWSWGRWGSPQSFISLFLLPTIWLVASECCVAPQWVCFRGDLIITTWHIFISLLLPFLSSVLFCFFLAFLFRGFYNSSTMMSVKHCG